MTKCCLRNGEADSTEHSIYFFYFLFSEKPAEFTKPLSDMTVKEKDTVILECDLNKPNVPVKWLKEGQEIKPDDHINFTVNQYHHQLVMTDVTLDDAARYTCVCGDVSTECTVKVTGLNLYLSLIFYLMTKF